MCSSYSHITSSVLATLPSNLILGATSKGKNEANYTPRKDQTKTARYLFADTTLPSTRFLHFPIVQLFFFSIQERGNLWALKREETKKSLFFAVHIFDTIHNSQIQKNTSKTHGKCTLSRERTICGIPGFDREWIRINCYREEQFPSI